MSKCGKPASEEEYIMADRIPRWRFGTTDSRGGGGGAAEATEEVKETPDGFFWRGGGREREERKVACGRQG